MNSEVKIEGVEVKRLTTHSDERGFFREVIRKTDDIFSEGFGQWSHSLMYQGTIKAWHLHRFQTDWWYVPSGIVRAVLYDMREDSSTYQEIMEDLLTDNVILKIPPGVAHGLKVIQGPAHLFYITSHIYNPDDELRISHDNPDIGYDWLKEAEIK